MELGAIKKPIECSTIGFGERPLERCPAAAFVLDEVA
jgi:hypothetical protein